MFTGVVDGVVTGEDQLRYGDEGIAFLNQAFDDSREGLRCIFCGVVEEDDGARLDLGGDTLTDLCGWEVFPIQAITTGKTFNGLQTKRRMTVQ